MKKKLLFVIPNLEVGGAEKSLVNLLNELDYDKYEVDLFLMSKTGIFLEQLPKEVNVLPESLYFKKFSIRFYKSLWWFLTHFKFSLVFYKILFTLSNRLTKNVVLSEQKNWRYLKHFFPVLSKEYDVSIGYLEKNANYIAVDSVKAKKYIGYIHNDYTAMGLYKKYDLPYFKKMNYVISVSENCVFCLEKEFPEFPEKFKLIYNVSSSKVIEKLSETKIEEDLKLPYIVSIGRLTKQKSFDLAIKACKILINRGLTINWYVIGTGELKEELEEQIKEHELEQYFFLLGIRKNPYPYVKNAMIYCQTSVFEGKSIAIDEAKILNKPIVITNFPTAKDQIQHLENGYICEINLEAIADAVELLIKDEKLREKFTENLSKEDFGIEKELEKFYKLIEEN